MKVLSSTALAALALAGAGAAAAQRPVPPAQLVQPAKPAAATPPASAGATATPPRKIPGLSDAGNATYAKVFGTPDPQLLSIVRQQRSLRASLMSMAMATTIDVDKLAGLLKQQQTLQDQFRGRQNELTVTMLRDLTDEDRGIYLRYSLTPATPNPATVR